MPSLTTHVLDTSRGLPAQGIAVELHFISGADRRLVAAATTNRDGRTDAPMLSGDELETGIYEFSFHAADYFHGLGVSLGVPPVFGVIVIRVGVSDPRGSYHIPLLLSPFGYTTYRGS